MTENKDPWWIASVYKVGIPSAIAIFLIWFLTQRIDSNMHRMQENLASHAQDSAYSVKTLEKMQSILQRICVNTSSNSETNINLCFQ